MPREKRKEGDPNQRPPNAPVGEEPNRGTAAKPTESSVEELKNLQDTAKQPEAPLKGNTEKKTVLRKNLGQPLGQPGVTSKEEKEARVKAVFRTEKEQDIGKYVFSNRSRNLLVFADLGFEDKQGKFSGLEFEPYQTRDLVAEGFEPADILQSKDLRKLIQNGYIMLGEMREGDRIPDTSVSAVLGGFDISKGDVQVPVHSEYYDKYLEFCAKEERSFKNAEL